MFDVHIERRGDHYIAIMEGQIVCKSETVRGVLATVAALKHLPAHILANALKTN